MKVENNSYQNDEFEMMGLHKIPEYEDIEPELVRTSLKIRNRLISIVSIILVAIGMTLLINSSTYSRQESVVSSASILESKSPIFHEAGNG